MMTTSADRHNLDQLEADLHSYRSDVLRYLQRGLPRHLQGEFDAEDLLQDVYFSASRALKQFSQQNEQSLRKWIFTIARNRLRNLIRDQSTAKRAGNGTDASEFALGRLLVMLDELAIYSRTPSQSAIDHESAVLLDRALSNLPHDYRTAIKLRYLDGKSVKEAARLMDRSDRAIHMLCFRALKDLRSALQGTPL